MLYYKNRQFPKTISTYENHLWKVSVILYIQIESGAYEQTTCSGFSIAILLTVIVVASIDLSQTADTVKAKGTTTTKYGSATKSQVCGDKLF